MPHVTFEDAVFLQARQGELQWKSCTNNTRLPNDAQHKAEQLALAEHELDVDLSITESQQDTAKRKRAPHLHRESRRERHQQPRLHLLERRRTELGEPARQNQPRLAPRLESLAGRRQRTGAVCRLRGRRRAQRSPACTSQSAPTDAPGCSKHNNV